MKRIKCIILILTLSIIICIIAIVAINNKKSKYGVEAEFPTLEINRNIEKLNNRNQYYILLECVKKFASYASNENYNAIKTPYFYFFQFPFYPKQIISYFEQQVNILN